MELVEIVGIRFKSVGKIYYFDPCGMLLKKDDRVIVETVRGQEIGTVVVENQMTEQKEKFTPLSPVIRVATPEDIETDKQNREKEKSAFATCEEKIKKHGLEMELVDVEYTFDNNKIIFFFVADGRVDFRELVKDLASVFRTRIELRQIGIRDEAKLLGGLGMCGRPLCCSVFLTDFGQVSIKMAKEQNLSLNSAKISGICGRLMCCLRYEHETYEYEIKRTPPVDSTVKTPDGIGTVTEISPLQGTIKVRLSDKPDIQPKTYHRKDVTVISK
jgi:cell fate regulator YaaT (PSP1 superfamily)